MYPSFASLGQFRLGFLTPENQWLWCCTPQNFGNGTAESLWRKAPSKVTQRGSSEGQVFWCSCSHSICWSSVLRLISPPWQEWKLSWLGLNINKCNYGKDTCPATCPKGDGDHLGWSLFSEDFCAFYRLGRIPRHVKKSTNHTASAA